MTDTTVDPDAPTEEHATIFADTIFAYLEVTMDALMNAQREILDANPEVKALDGSRLKEMMEKDERLSLDADFLKNWGAARSMNGAFIELEQLYKILSIFFSIKAVAELDIDLEAIIKEVAEEGKGE